VPRIAAANIEEHIRIQEQRVLDAAHDLFTTCGYRGTDMADIAKSMGLARNSLYRYYSSKDHILVAVVQQMEIAAGPCDAMTRMLGDIPPTASELRKEISALHEPLTRVLLNVVNQLLEGSGRDSRLVTAMIASMVQSAAGIAIQAERGDVCVAELRLSVGRVLAAGS